MPLVDFISQLSKESKLTPVGHFLQSFIYWAGNKRMNIELYKEEDIQKAMILFVKEIKNEG